MSSMQKAVDTLQDIHRRLDHLERGEKLPLWLRQASQKSASASPAFQSTIPPPSLSKVAVGLPSGSNAEAVLNDLLRDPILGDYVRRKMNEASF